MDIAERALQLKEDIDNAYEAGKGAMWDVVQNNGNRTDYDKGFAYWGNEELSPEHKVAPNGKCTEIFHGCTALKRIDESKFDLSKAKYSPTGTDSATYGTFWLCREIEVIPDIGLQAGAYVNTYAACMKMHTLKVMRVTEDCTFNVSVFSGCPELQNIEEIEGTIGKDFYINGCPKLSPKTLKRIIKHLKIYKQTEHEYKHIIAFNSTAFAVLEAEGISEEDWEWLAEQFPNANIELVKSMVDNSWETLIALCLGWNVTVS